MKLWISWDELFQMWLKAKWATGHVLVEYIKTDRKRNLNGVGVGKGENLASYSSLASLCAHQIVEKKKTKQNKTVGEQLSHGCLEVDR